MKRIMIGLLAILMIGLAILAQEKPPSAASAKEQRALAVSLSLNECIVKALENNLDISVAAFGPEISDAGITQAGEAFLPSFALGYNNWRLNQPSSWGIEGPDVLQKYDLYSLTVSQKAPTGAQVDLRLQNTMTNTTRAFALVNPAYDSSLRIDLTQPLLKGFGPKVNRIEITRARYQMDISLATLKSTLIQTIYDVEEAYWNLAYARESLSVIESSLEQSRELLRRNQEGERVGTKSAIDVLSAETEVANWEDSLIQARLAVETSEDRLKAFLNAPVRGEGESERFVPSDKPSSEKREVALEQALETAFRERPELEIAERQIDNSAADITYYKNQLLPQLDLSVSYWRPGQSGVKFIYLNNDPLTRTIIGEVKGNRFQSFEDIFKRNYNNWQIGLNFTLPLASVTSRAALVMARKQNDQNVKSLEKQKEAVAYEIAQVLKELKNNELRVASSTHYRELMEKRLEAETQRYSLGLVGSEWLFEYQRRLATARTQELKAIIDYNISLARLDRAQGTTLKAKNIKFRDYSL
jgi:outer membrane protein TolC